MQLVYLYIEHFNGKFFFRILNENQRLFIMAALFFRLNVSTPDFDEHKEIPAEPADFQKKIS